MKPLSCGSAQIWQHGTSLMNYLRMVRGTRGPHPADQGRVAAKSLTCRTPQLTQPTWGDRGSPPMDQGHISSLIPKIPRIHSQSNGPGEPPTVQGLLGWGLEPSTWAHRWSQPGCIQGGWALLL